MYTGGRPCSLQPSGVQIRPGSWKQGEAVRLPNGAVVPAGALIGRLSEAQPAVLSMQQVPRFPMPCTDEVAVIWSGGLPSSRVVMEAVESLAWAAEASHCVPWAASDGIMLVPVCGLLLLKASGGCCAMLSRGLSNDAVATGVNLRSPLAIISCFSQLCRQPEYHLPPAHSAPNHPQDHTTVVLLCTTHALAIWSSLNQPHSPKDAAAQCCMCADIHRQLMQHVTPAAACTHTLTSTTLHHPVTYPCQAQVQCWPAPSSGPITYTRLA